MARISDAEWVLLDLLWKHGELTITQMVKLLENTKGWSKHAIISFLNKMESKQLVYCHQGDRAKVYSAAVEREETAVSESVSFIDKVFHGKLGLMVSNLVENDKLNDDEIDELMSILEEKKRTNEH
ncbi:MAG: BlaI/MecI/CopY family transcriptional regulator [Lachnospiraceae bacterium]